MNKVKEMYRKYREIVLYLVFGVATTAVGFAVYYPLLLGGRAVFGIPPEDTVSIEYIALYTSAQILQWIAAVVFAFFTNRRFVFGNAEKNGSAGKQFGKFCAVRVITLGLDYAVTFGATYLLGVCFEQYNRVVLLGKERNANEIAAKLAAALIVVIANYVFSKIYVFGKSRRNKNKKGTEQ